MVTTFSTMSSKHSRPSKPNLEIQLGAGCTLKNHRNEHTDPFPASVLTHFTNGFTTGAAFSSNYDSFLSLEEAIAALRDIIDAHAKAFRLLDVMEFNSEIDGVCKKLISSV